MKHLFSLLLIVATIHSSPIVITGVPRSGIALLKKTVQEITGIKNIGACESDMFLKAEHFEKYNIIVGTPVCTQEHLELIKTYDAQVIHIIRDPRTLICKTAQAAHRYRTFIASARGKSVHQLITMLITNGGPLYHYQYPYPEVEKIGPITELYELWMPWSDYDNCLTITFEALSGLYGTEKQHAEIQKIAHFLSYPCGIQRCKKISQAIAPRTFFGIFFKKTSSDTWKKYFTQEHHEAFKTAAPSLLSTLGYEN